ncbi:MAG TPA: tetratricopeptide repeat protein, partial [Polyangia bacterium]|nr:tetratricopeptide repeat protein [Polyangia bacterium]
MLQVLTLTALLAAAGDPARAPTPVEQQRFEEGTRALSAGDARAAEKAFRAGYDAGHDPAFLVHLGEAQEKAGAPAEAAETYRRYLREAPDASDRADIEQRIARLAPAAPTAPPAAA